VGYLLKFLQPAQTQSLGNFVFERVEEILIDIPQVEIRSSEVKKSQNGCQLEAREIEKTGKHFIFYKKELLGLGLVDNELQINPLKVLTKGEKKENELK
jgi:tRNA U55 pseudouridine synthase TruB